ncbi:GSCFA domain-containing protein [Rhizobium sp. LjRoot254]|uniref:GSCFA domain-containing protein n=1 Tax=Rhizobium sp. LjRoot254 TaxID=3342297 RepID=UPI003ED0865F
MKKDNPYSSLPASRYWKSAVAERHVTELEDLYQPKFVLRPSDRITVAGSCFAQHVGRNLKAQGFDVLDKEPPPEFLSEDVARTFGYGIYSGRYGNIYTARQLVQLIKDSADGVTREEDFWWRGERVFDALRPNVEPDGLESVEEAVLHRRQHLSKVQALFGETDVMIFTLGLTEAWESVESGIAYPTCPGVIAGAFDQSKCRFVNYDFNAVLADMVEVRALLKAINPDMKLLLTVSPVPLTATASGRHVLVATTYSKSVLRAVCGSLSGMFDDVDYFPSYELIASPAARGFFYEPNLRSINRNGVALVMSQFLKAHAAEGASISAPATAEAMEAKAARASRRKAKEERRGDVVCEEELLEAFAR